MNVLLITIRPLIVYLFFNRQTVTGMTAGAVKRWEVMDPCPLGPNPDIMSSKPNGCFEETASWSQQTA